MIKALCDAVIIILCSFLLYFACWIPCVCESAKPRLTQMTVLAATQTLPLEAGTLARRNLDTIAPLLSRCPHDVSLLMIAAANQRVLGRADIAIALYRKALFMSRRPEIYWNLGESYYEGGHRDLALHWMSQAASFAPSYLQEMDRYGELRAPLQDYVTRRENLIRAGRWREELSNPE